MSDTTASSTNADRSTTQAENILERAEAALRDVEESLRAPNVKRYDLEELVGSDGPPEKVSIDLLRDVQLELKIELGRTRMSLDEILRLRKGSVITLDKLAGDPVDIFVNGRLVARGEVLVLNDNFCVRVAELVGSDAI
ncbi:Flagellar motor switch protein FliN [Pirellula sp. SH-Sr6A]|uniref:flagellar motor switch protein FliN n=1 Tax=Pirellula sp. SH-Sr6A TaxID=1632865 RepID=UPI00078D9BB5|nr:flagellar motor switch protein FliN [Pirellula sp. SH-Sr6A]AMV35171.1 Flagellar motor switch protein FliN [Pirellula sp. SH-Sr6A]